MKIQFFQQTEAPSAAKNKEPQAPQPTAHQQSQEEASQQEQELDLFDPVDILPKLPADFAELIADKKWQNRKTALETLTNLVTENPKLQDNQDYGQLMDNLTRVRAQLSYGNTIFKHLLGSRF